MGIVIGKETKNVVSLFRCVGLIKCHIVGLINCNSGNILIEFFLLINTLVMNTHD